MAITHVEIHFRCEECDALDVSQDISDIPSTESGWIWTPVRSDIGRRAYFCSKECHETWLEKLKSEDA